MNVVLPVPALPVIKRQVGTQLLRERAAHKEIPEVDDDAGADHFDDPRGRTDQDDRSEFSCGCDHARGHKARLERVHADPAGSDAERERDGKIAHADRDPVPQPSCEPRNAAGL